MARSINPRFDFYKSTSQCYQLPATGVQSEASVLDTGLHNGENNPGNYLTPMLFNEYERILLSIANIVGDLPINTDIFTGCTTIPSFLQRIGEKYVMKDIGGTIAGPLHVIGNVEATGINITSLNITYVEGMTCYPGDVVMVDGEFYQCKTKVLSMPNSSEFHKVSMNFMLIAGKTNSSFVATTDDTTIFSVGSPVVRTSDGYRKASTSSLSTCAIGVVSSILDSKTMVVVTSGLMTLPATMVTNIIGSFPNTLYVTQSSGYSLAPDGYSNPLMTIIGMTGSDYEVLVHGGAIGQYVDVIVDTFIANGSKRTFVLSKTPYNPAAMLLSADGCVVTPTLYSVNPDASVTFTAIPAANTRLVMFYPTVRNDLPYHSINKHEYVHQSDTPLTEYVPTSPEDSGLITRSAIIFRNGKKLQSSDAISVHDYISSTDKIIFTTPLQKFEVISVVSLKSTPTAIASPDSVTGEQIQHGIIDDIHLSPDVASRYTDLLSRIETLDVQREMLANQLDEVQSMYYNNIRNLLSIDMTGFAGTRKTLTETEANYQGFIVTGALTANVNIIVPAIARQYKIMNSTSGAFTLGVKTAEGEAAIVVQGRIRDIVCDGSVCTVLNVAPPSGVNGNILLSDGAGNAKDSTIQIGNATGNVPLANGVKCVNLYGDMSDHLKQDEIATGAIRDIVDAHFTGHTTVKFLHVTELCTDNPSGSRMTLEIHYLSADYIRVFARNLFDKRTWSLYRDNNGWQTGGTYNGWTQLTDASGNAINANSLGEKTYASLFDASGNAINANSLGGQLPAYYGTAANVSTLQGYFTGGMAKQALAANGGSYSGPYLLAYIQNDLRFDGLFSLWVQYNPSCGDYPTADETNWIGEIDSRNHTSDTAGKIVVTLRFGNGVNDLRTWVRRWDDGAWASNWTQLTNADGSPAQLPLTPSYDLVIDSDAKLAALAASGTYAKVLIKAGTWTLASGGVNLTARGTKQVVGEPGSLLVFSSTMNGLYYTTYPTTTDYRMEGVNVQASWGGVEVRAFYGCSRLTNCTGTGTGSGTSGYAFSNCVYLTNCIGAGDGTSDEGAGFRDCSYLTNCYGTGLATSGRGAGFSNCTLLTGCKGSGATSSGGPGYGFCSCHKVVNNTTGECKTAKYISSYADTGTTAPCAGNAAGGWNS